MLDSFASVGAHRFDVTFFHIDGHKRGLRKDQSIKQVTFPSLIHAGFDGAQEQPDCPFARGQSHQG
jgi:hypothetical protein